MVIPRKSYEDLQNELLEKIKQIDELTSRFVVGFYQLWLLQVLFVFKLPKGNIVIYFQMLSLQWCKLINLLKKTRNTLIISDMLQYIAILKIGYSRWKGMTLS